MTLESATSSPEDKWREILEPGESILWQGAPETGRFMTPIARRYLVAFAMLLAAAVVADLTNNGIEDRMLALRVLVLASLCAGAWQAIRFWDRRRSFYTLTDRRAIIGTWKFGIQNLKCISLFTDAPLSVDDRGESLLTFARERRVDDGGTVWIDIGFRGLRDPHVPWQIIRDLRAARAGDQAMAPKS